MFNKDSIFLNLLENSDVLEKYKQIIENDEEMRIENALRDVLFNLLPKPRQDEVPLLDVGAIQAWGDIKGKVDIVLDGKFGIELKVVRLPRLNAVPSKALYDIGQLASDYWRISHAKKLNGGLLLVLVYGSLVSELQNPTELIREFHNRLYVDFITSLKYGELSGESLKTKDSEYRKFRSRQVKSIKEMGLDEPFNAKNKMKCKMKCIRSENVKDLALIRIPVLAVN